MGVRRLVRAVLVSGAVLAVVGAGGAQAAPLGQITQITQFAAGLNSGSTPNGIASGPDGNMWFTDDGCSSSDTCAIGRITPSGQISEFSAGLDPGSQPGFSIAPGADGNMWFTDIACANSATALCAIGRITLSGQITEFSAGLNPGSLPAFGIAPGADGNMWFTDLGCWHRAGTCAIGRITPSGQITEFTAGLNPGSWPQWIAPGGDGNMWFTDAGCTGSGVCAIGRITPSGQITEFTVGLNPGSSPFAIAEGPDGSLWFTDQGCGHGGACAIGHITTSGQITEFPAGFAISIAPGPNGDMWAVVADGCPGSGPCTIADITPSGQITDYGLPAPAAAIAPSADGNMWFTDDGIFRIGAGEPAASLRAPSAVGPAQPGSRETCASGEWAHWAGLQPIQNAATMPSPGTRWLLDGATIPNATAPSYLPTAADAGHQLACTVTVTYPVLDVTATATSVPVRIAVRPSRPTITRLRQSKRTWRDGSRLAVISPRRTPEPGTMFSFKLNEPATLRLTFARDLVGRERRGKCVAPTQRDRQRPACRRAIAAGMLSLRGRSGAENVYFDGRLSRSRTLTPGQYTVTFTAIDAVRRSAKPQRLTFTIVTQPPRAGKKPQA